MKIRTFAALGALTASLLFPALAMAQDSSYTPGTVWQFSGIRINPGQFEEYMDYLAGNYKKVQELGKKEGYVVSYHVFAVNQRRENEPDLVLAIEYKDYTTTAQQLDFQKKVEKMLAADARKQDDAFGDRGAMRTVLFGMEVQELNLK